MHMVSVCEYFVPSLYPRPGSNLTLHAAFFHFCPPTPQCWKWKCCQPMTKAHMLKWRSKFRRCSARTPRWRYSEDESLSTQSPGPHGAAPAPSSTQVRVLFPHGLCQRKSSWNIVLTHSGFQVLIFEYGCNTFMGAPPIVTLAKWSSQFKVPFPKLSRSMRAVTATCRYTRGQV